MDEPASDWRDLAAYAPLLRADRSFIAWEWLRRCPGYRRAAELAFESGCEAQPERWGLHAFERPQLRVPEVRPVWTSPFHDLVLETTAEPPGDAPDAFDLSRLDRLATLVESPVGQHLLLSDGLRSIRLDVVKGGIGKGPVRLCHRLCGLASAERPLLTLRRLIALCGSGCFAASLHPREARAARFVLMLRAHDAMRSGASQREIAEVLLSAEAGLARWRVAAPTLRSRVQRLTRAARVMAAGGYRSLLD